MKRKWLMNEISITAVVLLIMTSFCNVVGYQTFQTSQKNVITESINQRELLFQTIVDITNNKEIQRIILKLQLSGGISPISDIPVLTKNQLKQIYFLGLILSKFISKSRIYSMIGKYQFRNEQIQKEISATIDNNPTFKEDITQLQNSECDCENEHTTEWKFPIICLTFAIVQFFILLLGFFVWNLVSFPVFQLLLMISISALVFVDWTLAAKFDCVWLEGAPVTVL